MKEIETILKSTRQPKSKNLLSLDAVKTSLSDYLDMRAEEVENFPEEKKRSHWNLIAADYDSKKDAQFLAMYFNGARAIFLAGTGNPEEVRDFALNSFPDDANKVLPQLERRFATSARCELAFEDITQWVAK